MQEGEIYCKPLTVCLIAFKVLHKTYARKVDNVKGEGLSLKGQMTRELVLCVAFRYVPNNSLSNKTF